MGDASREKASTTNRIIGENEDNVAKVSVNGEFSIRDTHDNGGADSILALTITPKLGVTNVDGVTPKAERKYVIMEALDTNVVWGFANTTQSFDLFKSQLIMVPVGPNTQIWLKMKSAIGNVAFGEIS